jgi:ATP-dependent RNA helicase DOB1
VYQNVKELEERLSGLRVRNEEEVESYSRLWDQLASLSQQFHAFLTRPQYIVPFLQPGRLVKVPYRTGSSVADPNVFLLITF